MWIILALLLPLASDAGPNANGALVVHTRNDMAYTADRICEDWPLPPTCESLNTTSTLEYAFVWVVGAFPRQSNPRVAAVKFGIQYPMDLDWMIWYGPCGPYIAEIPDANWPVSGSGTEVVYSPPVTDRLSKLYFFELDWAAIGNTFGTTGYHGPTAEFLDDAIPRNTDPCAFFGHVTYGATGHKDCPDEAAGADLLLPVTITSVSPNPFVGSTRISLSLTRPGPVRVEVLDAAGRRAALVADLACEPGVHSFNWNASETRS
ncbi:MAG TPA: hypothetical protein VF827_04695, partial [Syntrophales bacterium]